MYEVYEIGELVRWRCPLDADYSYGTILEINKNIARVEGSGYYTGVVTDVHLKYIEKLKRGGGGFGLHKRNNKRSTT